MILSVGGGSHIEHRSAMQDDPQRRRPDISRAKTYIGWQPQVSEVVNAHSSEPQNVYVMSQKFSRTFCKIFRLHRSTTYVDVAYCYRQSSVVCPSVTLVSPAKTAEPIVMPFGLRTRVGPGNHVLDGDWGSRCLRVSGNFEGGKGASHCKV